MAHGGNRAGFAELVKMTKWTRDSVRDDYKLFMFLADKRDWKNPINAKLRLADFPIPVVELTARVKNVVDFYTSTDAAVVHNKRAGTLTVTAQGYRMGPAGCC